ncbi:Aste57867_1896 [Aphanomyces stellatus]|uniref:Aste57867_1896 protein n=1 Tax=Aphanomyces stellatus TaxID=120398 RepID=A0A485KBG0_9STRA|nr:hypothetical protein As57867_001894 [Aphanomyces stellatus]VFT79103.1 Aste57867_1896 [Aphanomyces stellatus]
MNHRNKSFAPNRASSSAPLHPPRDGVTVTFMAGTDAASDRHMRWLLVGWEPTAFGVSPTTGAITVPYEGQYRMLLESPLPLCVRVNGTDVALGQTYTLMLPAGAKLTFDKMDKATKYDDEEEKDNEQTRKKPTSLTLMWQPGQWSHGLPVLAWLKE